MVRKLIFVVFLAIYAQLVGCNTMQGLGKDISNLGGKIEQKAGESK